LDRERGKHKALCEKPALGGAVVLICTHMDSLGRNYKCLFQSFDNNYRI